MRDHYELKKRLNAKARREAEDKRINELESHYLPLWIYFAIAVIITLGISLINDIPPAHIKEYQPGIVTFEAPMIMPASGARLK